jgi:hypothetical protein
MMFLGFAASMLLAQEHPHDLSLEKLEQYKNHMKSFRKKLGV